MAFGREVECPERSRGTTNIINQKTIRPSYYKNKPKSTAKFFRVNQQIRAQEVQVIDENGEPVGILPTVQAINLAAERGFDLVEVSPVATPPVCRIIDYGKFQYQQSRNQQKSKKVDTKEVRLSFKIGEHDLMIREKQVGKFLSQGHRVKIDLRLRGREKAFKHKGREVVQSFLDKIQTPYKIDKPISVEGGTFTVIITKGQ